MYNVYDKPWRAGANLAEKIYRPGKAVDKDVYGDDVEKLIKTNRCSKTYYNDYFLCCHYFVTVLTTVSLILIYQLVFPVRFQPDRGFAGADTDQSREGPVQFEKAVEEDPFGLNKFLTEAKKAKRPSEDSRWDCIYVLVRIIVVLFSIQGSWIEQGKKTQVLDMEVTIWLNMDIHYTCTLCSHDIGFSCTKILEV